LLFLELSTPPPNAALTWAEADVVAAAGARVAATGAAGAVAAAGGGGGEAVDAVFIGFPPDLAVGFLSMSFILEF
jgi:hypothetical protein